MDVQARRAFEEGPYRSTSIRTSGGGRSNGGGRSSIDLRVDTSQSSSPTAVLGASGNANAMQPGSPRETLPLKRPAPDAPPSPGHSDSSVGPSIGDHISGVHGISSISNTAAGAEHG
jgi:hypothetical protein